MQELVINMMLSSAKTFNIWQNLSRFFNALSPGLEMNKFPIQKGYLKMVNNKALYIVEKHFKVAVNDLKF